jgi:hypothetical protein
VTGWHISVYRQKDGGASPATAESERGTRLAVWQTDFRGLEWIEDLIKAGTAIDLGGNGYPCRFTATAENLLPHITGEPPRARIYWLREEGDIVTDQWEGKTVIDANAMEECRPGEWLQITAWDES